MTLTSGTRLGPYEIVDAIDAGGMGEVCRARDTRLNRTVAIKVMPASLAADTAKAGGTNADDLTDQLRDLPVVVHRSCFSDATLLPDLPLNETYFSQLYPPAADKLETLLGYIGLGNRRTRLVVDSRGSWATDEAKAAWVMQLERRFPRLQGRVTAYRVPADRPTFRHPATAADMKQIVTSVLAAIQGPS